MDSHGSRRERHIGLESGVERVGGACGRAEDARKVGMRDFLGKYSKDGPIGAF